MARFKVKQLRLKIAEAVSNRLRLKATSNRLLAVAVLVQRAVGKFFNPSDTATIADIIAAILGKPVEDQVSSTDLASLDVGISPEDAAVIAEQAALSASKPLTDSGSATDLANLAILKSFSDSGLFTDANALTFGKQPDDSVAFAESVGFDVAKALQDSPAFTDLASKAFSKSFSDSVNFSDVINAISGIGNEEDLSDSGSITDLANVTFGKQAVETITFAEAQTFGITKGLSDTVYATDDIGAEATIDDDQTLQVQKRLIELPSITDLISRVAAYIRSFSDSAGVADSISLEAAYQRDFTESPVASDSVAVSAGYNRTASDSGSVADQVVSLVGKAASDIMNGSDSGVLLNQDYVDNNLYFADDYVGLKRIF